MDAASQAWALAPWLGDSLFASARLLAGQDARGALNLLWLGLATSALHRLTRSFAPQRPAAPWLAVASFASLPVVAVLVAGMQVELILMALLLALLDLWRSHPSNGDPAPRGRTLACLVGGLLATKLSTLPVLLLIACHALWRRRGRLDPRTLLGPALLVALVGGSAYTYAAWLAGNPVLPLANDVFQSRFFSPAAFSDARYPSGISLPLLWDWAFASRQVYESWNGVSGFQWLALGGLGLLALRGRRALTALGALGLAWFLIQFQLMAYLRYLTPPLVLLLPALAIAATERARPLGAVLAVLAVAGNLAMQANANWLLRDFGVADILRAKGETEQLVARVAPELPLIERARARTARPRILLADPTRPFAAACGGCAFVRNWYDHELKARLAGDEPDALRRALQPLGFSHVILYRGSASASAFEPALEALGAVPIAHLNGAELWELPPAPPTATDLFEQRDLARQHVHRPRPPSSTGNP